MSYLERFKQFVAFIQTQSSHVELVKCETFDPISLDEIRQVETKIGRKLPDEFLSYFKESNGYKLMFIIKSYNREEIAQGKGIGALYIPSLREIFNTPISNYSLENQYRLDILGGKDDFEIRNRMFLFDKYDVFRDESIYTAFYYVIDDDVLLLSDDYEACISDAHPITITAYMELCLANAFLVNRVNLLQKGCEGNYKIFDISNIKICSWDKLFCKKLISSKKSENRCEHVKANKQCKAFICDKTLHRCWFHMTKEQRLLYREKQSDL